jgi:hypothetical protein
MQQCVKLLERLLTDTINCLDGRIYLQQLMVIQFMSFYYEFPLHWELSAQCKSLAGWELASWDGRQPPC